MSNFRKIFRRLRTLLWTALTIVTVLAAVTVGIGKLLMPYSDYYEPQMEAWLSKSFNQPVTVESFEGEWKAFGPRISLQGLTFTAAGNGSGIALKKAALDIKPLNALIPWRPLYSFRIIGADLSLERTADGRYLLSGLGVSDNNSGQKTNPQLRNVALNGEVLLEDSSFSFDDPGREIHIVLTQVNGRLKMDGDTLATEIQARVSDKSRRQVVGDLEAVVQVKLDGEQHLSKAAWHIKTGELMLAELVRQLPHHPLMPVSGRLNAELWGSWAQGEEQEMQGVMDLRSAELSSQSGPLLIEHLNSRFNWRFAGRQDWRIDLADVNIKQDGVTWQTPRLSVARDVPQDLGLWVSADFLRLDFPVQLTERILASNGTAWPAAIPTRARGRVSNLDLLLDSKWHLKQLDAGLQAGHFWGLDKGPEVSGIDAQIQLARDGGNITFDGTELKLDWLRVFRRQIGVELRDCSLDVVLGADKYWQLDLTYCHIENPDISGFGRVRLAASEGKPEIDINAVMEHGDISRFADYWPENVLKEKTLHWLRTSLLGGRIEGGRYSLVGDLDDFPFRDHSGVSQAIASISGVDVRYLEDWPNVRQATAIAEFEGSGMHIEGRIGNTAGVPVDQVVVSIEDFRSPTLVVDYQTKDDLSNVAEFLKQTPLLESVSLDPEQFALAGPVEVSGRLHTLLGSSADTLKLNGKIELQNATFLDKVSLIELTGLNGTLNYDRDGLDAKQIQADFQTYPTLVDIKSVWDADEVFRADLTGELPADIVIPRKLMESEPLFSRAVGVSLWDISLQVAAQQGQGEGDIWVELDSTLQGTMVDLPAPLNKAADASWPLKVRYPIRADGNILSAVIPGKMSLQMELEPETSSPRRAVLQLGEGKGQLPANGLFTIAGTTDTLDLDQCLDLVIEYFQGSEDGGGLEFQTATINASQIILFDRLFNDVVLSMDYQDGIVHGVFDGADIAGKVSYYQNEQGTQSLNAEFERLVMPDPESTGVSMNTDPANMPELRFYSKSFSYLGLELGETRMEGYPVQNGFHLDSIEAHSPELQLSASGDWLKDANGEGSDFNIRVSSESLGAVLQAMDISSAMSGGQTVVNFDARWDGPPAAFAMDRLNGEMDLSIIQGNILTATAGAGRVLGLLSLSELPRRLAMDFRDVFGQGFSFDEASGTIQLENGISHTNDLVLKSTAAEIAIIGSTDLSAKTFNYDVTIRPGVSKAFPVIGAIAGGPVGAAAGLALQALFRDSLGEAAEARYTIRGPWADPQIESVDVFGGTNDNPSGEDQDAPQHGPDSATPEPSDYTSDSGLSSAAPESPDMTNDSDPLSAAPESLDNTNDSNDFNKQNSTGDNIND